MQQLATIPSTLGPARRRRKQALGVTQRKRPDLLDELELSEEQKALLDEFERDQNN